MKKLLSIFMILTVFFSSSCFVYAEEPTFPEESIAADLESELESEPAHEETTEPFVIEFEQPMPVYPVNPDDYNGSQISTWFIRGDVYAGSYNSTIVTMWEGIIQNNIGKDYVAFRSSQYDYYLFIGQDFTYSGGIFSGSGIYYHLNTYQNYYGYSIGSDSFSIDPANGYLFTNVSSDYPSLVGERELQYEKTIIIILISLLGFSVLKWIFIRK